MANFIGLVIALVAGFLGFRIWDIARGTENEQHARKWGLYLMTLGAIMLSLFIL